MTWKPPANVRRKEIVAAARERGAEAGSVACTIPGCRCVGRPQVIFLLPEAIELYGPPDGGIPVGRDDLEKYARRAARDVKHHEVATLRLEKAEWRDASS